MLTLLFALKVCSFNPQESTKKFTFERKFVVGETVTYQEKSTDMSFEQPDSPTPQVTTERARKLELKTVSYDSSKQEAELDWRIFDFFEKSDLDTPSAPLPKEHTFNVLADTFGQIRSVNVTQLNEQERKTMAGSFWASLTVFELPRRAIKIGETWTVTCPASTGAFEKDQTLTAKLVAVKQEGNVNLAEIRVSGTLEIVSRIVVGGGTADGEKLPEMKMIGDEKLEVVYKMEVATGRIRSATRKSNSDLKMDFGDGNSAPITRRYRATFELVK